jgi:hypothetical protein
VVVAIIAVLFGASCSLAYKISTPAQQGPYRLVPFPAIATQFTNGTLLVNNITEVIISVGPVPAAYDTSSWVIWFDASYVTGSNVNATTLFIYLGSTCSGTLIQSNFWNATVKGTTSYLHNTVVGFYHAPVGGNYQFTGCIQQKRNYPSGGVANNGHMVTATIAVIEIPG